MPVDTSLLDQLRDVIPPPDPGLWPPAIGWWVLAILLILLPFGIRYLLSLIRENRARQHIARDISQAVALKPDQAAIRLSILMRRVAMSKFPNASVAGLTGEQWLEFLDSSGETDQFTQGPGRLLITAPYERHRVADVDPLTHVCMKWVTHVT
ncbi:MAG: DUF4381 domain-containing protein [Acidiferrobacterales bacterium]|nr:DUF4381 domain-containing protein [Acidiferrobacterales bacterium]